MDDEYNDSQDSMNDSNRNNIEGNENGGCELQKDFSDGYGYEENYDEEDSGNGFRGGRGGRGGNFRGRGRGPPPGWMNGPPPMRFRGRGYGPGGPPMRGRGFFRGRGGPRFGPNNGPNYDGNWGPMGPPPPGMMGGPPPFGPPPGVMGPGGPMGPPPNMMGQPPPFGGPPGMPPPNMPTPEFWVETKSEDGKSYYYHARSRETTWTRPQESPTCKVITQAEMEAMATNQISNLSSGPQSMTMGSMTPMHSSMPSAGAPYMQPPPWANNNNNDAVNEDRPMSNMFNKDSGPPSFMQPPPWVIKPDGAGKDNSQSDMTSPNDDESPPGEGSLPMNAQMKQHISQQMNQQMNQQMTQPTMNQPTMNQPTINQPSMNQTPMNQTHMNQPRTGGPMSFPGPGGPGGPGGPSGPGGPGGPFPWGWPGAAGWPPPLVGPPPNINNVTQPSAVQSQPLVTSQPAPVAASEPPGEQARPDTKTVIPPELAAAAAEWTSHRAPDGRPYYYNAKKQESVWTKPKPMAELEELQAKIAAEQPAGAKPDTKMDIMDGVQVDESKIEVIDVDAQEEAQTAAAAAAEREAEAKRLEAEKAEAEEKERQQKEKEREEKEKKEKEKKEKKDANGPLWSMHIAGTPWRVVWTAGGDVFYYNPTIPLSSWTRPAQLMGREDVDCAISQPPGAFLELQRKLGLGNKTQPTAATTTTPAAANGALKRTADSSSEDSDTEPAKKSKPEEVNKKPTQGTLDAGKAIEAEVKAARERALVPLDQRMKTFRQMLLESGVSAFSTWEKELHKIVFDSRYLLLTSKERKQVFEKYVRERAEEERNEKKNRIQQQKVAFRELMEEAKLHSKSSYKEFSSKHSKDERFRAVDKKHLREQYFTEYQLELKKKEKEEKEKKREQVKVDFIALLKEKSVDRHARWPDAKKKVDSDPRYKAVDSSTLREDYFREYCKIMKEERKKDKDTKEKDRDRSSSKKEKKDKDREKEKDKDKEKKEKKGKKEKGSDKSEEERQPTPPPETWAEIIGVPEKEKQAKKAAAKAAKADKKLDEKKGKEKKTQHKNDKAVKASSPESEPEIHSPKRLRSSTKDIQTPDKKSPQKSDVKSPVKTPDKRKRKTEIKSPEVEEEVEKSKEKISEVKEEKKGKAERKKRKKSEKE